MQACFTKLPLATSDCDLCHLMLDFTFGVLETVFPAAGPISMPIEMRAVEGFKLVARAGEGVAVV